MAVQSKKRIDTHLASLDCSFFCTCQRIHAQANVCQVLPGAVHFAKAFFRYTQNCLSSDTDAEMPTWANLNVSMICLHCGLLRFRSFQIHSSLHIHMRFCMHTGILTTWATSVKKSQTRCEHVSVFLAHVSMWRHMRARTHTHTHLRTRARAHAHEHAHAHKCKDVRIICTCVHTCKYDTEF